MNVGTTRVLILLGNILTWVVLFVLLIIGMA